MEHRSPHRPALRRLTALLLAGTAVGFTVQAAQSARAQSFWLTPTVLAGSLGLENAKTSEQLKALQQKTAPASQVRLFASVDPMWEWDAKISAPLSFGQSATEDAPVAFKLRAASFDFEPSVGAKVDRLAEGQFSSLVPTQTVGFDAALSNGRFVFSSDIAQPVDRSDRRDFRDTQLRGTDRSIRLDDTSRRHRFAAKVIDTEKLRLLVDGEFGQVSEEFASTMRELPTGRLVLPGQWSSLSSRLEFGSANVSVDYQDYVTREESIRRQGLRLGYASSELSLYSKEGMEFNLTQGGQWLKRTAFTGVNADVIVADVLPDAVAEAIDPIRPFLPTVINAGFERGDIIRAELLPGPRDKVSTGTIAMTWDHDYGQTTASFWERRVATDVIMPDGEDKIPLLRSRDRFVDISHKIRRGNWQFGAGLSLIETDDTVNNFERRAEREIAPHVSIAYAPENGPRVELRFGAADAQSQIIDDNVAARAKTRQLALSVDLSNFAQDELNKPDAKLKLEYRYDLSGSDRDPITQRERGGGHALLLTFAAPLN